MFNTMAGMLGAQYVFMAVGGGIGQSSTKSAYGFYLLEPSSQTPLVYFTISCGILRGLLSCSFLKMRSILWNVETVLQQRLRIELGEKNLLKSLALIPCF